MRRRLVSEKPTKDSLSAEFGFSVPETFVSLIGILYEQSSKQAMRWPDLFTTITGLELVEASFRCPQTPPELFSFAALGVDGVHYGYAIHAPELPTHDYPVGELCPMEDEGVLLVGSTTLEALESLMSDRLAHGIEASERHLVDQVSQALGLHPTAQKAQRRYDPEGNGLRILPVVPEGWQFIPTTDGIGVLARVEAFRPGSLERVDAFMSPEVYLQEADQALRQDFPATALYYLREGYWHNWTNSQIATAFIAGLGQAYSALGRPVLAKISDNRGNPRSS